MAAPAWEAYRRVGGIAPQNKFWVLGSLKCYFLHFGGIILQNSEDYTASSNSCTTAVVSGRYLDDCATEVPGSNRINCDRKYRYELIMSEQRREKILGWRSPKQNRNELVCNNYLPGNIFTDFRVQRFRRYPSGTRVSQDFTRIQCSSVLNSRARNSAGVLLSLAMQMPVNYRAIFTFSVQCQLERYLFHFLSFVHRRQNFTSDKNS